jgi:hypothetical protein
LKPLSNVLYVITRLGKQRTSIDLRVVVVLLHVHDVSSIKLIRRLTLSCGKLPLSLSSLPLSLLELPLSLP